MASPRVCSIPECRNPHFGRGWCRKHYKRWYQNGDPLIARVYGSAANYFADVVLPYRGDDCLIWPFNRTRGGYGQLSRDGRKFSVHRVVCEAVNGPSPSPQHDAAHSCGRGHFGCVNPKHLRWATKAENQADKVVHGTMLRGTQVHGAKLTPDAVRHIRELAGTTSYAKIGEMFGVSGSAIREVIDGHNWSWVS